jgi:hypothetical protein
VCGGDGGAEVVVAVGAEGGVSRAGEAMEEGACEPAEGEDESGGVEDGEGVEGDAGPEDGSMIVAALPDEGASLGGGDHAHLDEHAGDDAACFGESGYWDGRVCRGGWDGEEGEDDGVAVFDAVPEAAWAGEELDVDEGDVVSQVVETNTAPNPASVWEEGRRDAVDVKVDSVGVILLGVEISTAGVLENEATWE